MHETRLFMGTPIGSSLYRFILWRRYTAVFLALGESGSSVDHNFSLCVHASSKKAVPPTITLAIVRQEPRARLLDYRFPEMNVIGIFVAAIVISVSIVNVAVVISLGSTGVMPREGEAPLVPPPGPPGTCARYTPDPEAFLYTEYYENTCQENVTEASCVPSSPGELVYWTESVPCTPGFTWYDYSSAGSFPSYELVEPAKPFYQCCPANSVLLLEQNAYYDVGQTNITLRRVCVNARSGALFPVHLIIGSIATRRGSFIIF